MKIKVLNLYAGIGGNVANLDRDKYEITSVEYDSDIAVVYHRRFPLDRIIIGDAKNYLLNNYMHFDFIWASPPCQSHSRSKNSLNKDLPYFVDLSLYEVILFLRKYCNDKYWVVENVIPFYEPLIPYSYVFTRHFIWCNFVIGLNFAHTFKNIEQSSVEELEKFFNIDDDIFFALNIDYKKKRQILRNMCDYHFSLLIDYAFNNVKEHYHQISLF